MSDSLRASSPSSRRIGGVNDNKQNRAAKAVQLQEVKLPKGVHQLLNFVRIAAAQV